MEVYGPTASISSRLTASAGPRTTLRCRRSNLGVGGRAFKRASDHYFQYFTSVLQPPKTVADDFVEVRTSSNHQ